MSNIFLSLTKLFKKPLSEVAKELNYSEENILILSENFEKLKSDHPKTWNALLSCKHNSDKRTFEKYALDLVSSWVYEDTVYKFLSKTGYDISLSGSDQNRNILPNSKVTSNSDFSIKRNNILRHVELINSYTDYWNRTNKIDLRDNKYIKLKNSEAIILCIDVFFKKFYIIDLGSNNYNIKFIPYHEPYGKSVYQIDIREEKSIEFTINNLVNEINKLF